MNDDGERWNSFVSLVSCTQHEDSDGGKKWRVFILFHSLFPFSFLLFLGRWLHSTGRTTVPPLGRGGDALGWRDGPCIPAAVSTIHTLYPSEYDLVLNSTRAGKTSKVQLLPSTATLYHVFLLWVQENNKQVSSSQIHKIQAHSLITHLWNCLGPFRVLLHSYIQVPVYSLEHLVTWFKVYYNIQQVINHY
jgi:hypothetical protein